MALHDDNLNRPDTHALRDTNGRDSRGEAALATANAYSNGAETTQSMTRRVDTFGVGGATPRFSDYDAADGFDLKQIGQILMRRRRVILAVFVLVFASIAAWTLRATPIYRATALIRIINSDTQSIPGLPSMLTGGGAERAVDTEIRLIDTDALKQTALTRLSPEFQEILQNKTSVDVNDVRDTELVAVSVDSPKKAASVAYANEICKTYVQQSQSTNRNQMQQASEYVDRQMKTVYADLDKARAALEAYKNQSRVPNIESETSSAMAQLGQMESDLSRAKADRASAQSSLAALERQLRGLPREQRGTRQFGQSVAYSTIQQQLAKLEVERVSAIKEYAPGAPEISEIDEQITALRKRLTQAAQAEVKQETVGVNPIWQSSVQNAADLRGQIAGFLAREKALVAGIEQVKLRLARLPATERRLATLSAKVRSLENAYASFADKKQSIDVQVISRQANGKLEVPATNPKYPVSPHVTRNLVLGFLLGILLALGFAVLIDVLDDRVHSDEDVRLASGLPVLTHVPDIKEISQQTLIGLPGSSDRREGATTTLAAASHYHAAPLLESFRMLRANIMFSATVEPIHSIVVTSSRPAEGKSSSALNLAIALAMDGKNVILVDCDLRRPKVHDLLGLRNNIGFTSVVTGQLQLNEALQPTVVPNLQVLTGGPVPPNPTELLNSRAGRACLQQLMRQAEFVILDTPPALVMADAQVVASQADAVLLVVSANEADKREVSRTTELMSQTGARMLGTVLNKSDVSTGGYYNYRTYSQYYSRLEEMDSSSAPAGDQTNATSRNGHTVLKVDARLEAGRHGGNGANDAAHGEVRHENQNGSK